MSGPVGIVKGVSDTYEAGRAVGWFSVFVGMLNWTILLSANLGVMNLLPLPALDGGRLVFLIIEAICGKALTGERGDGSLYRNLPFDGIDGSNYV